MSVPSMCRNKSTNATIKHGFWRRLFNDTVHMKFRVCFIIAKYENYIFSLCETSNASIDAFYHYKIYFYQSEPLKVIVTMLKSVDVLFGLSLVWNRYTKGSHKTGATKISIIAYDEIEDRICKE